ncbi:hypothetical protein AKO1_005674 [Acrasis kona]|uniref:Uncharacterized protein n=1 Tax=Acrasis kona TaxID=1008807 RepID=A0AAW2YLE0_9EUKA
MVDLNKQTTVEDLLERIKISLLCGQRCSWEQGTAAIAFKELNENNFVLNMAHDAVVRTGKDGRVATQYNHAVNENAQNDPFVNLEAVLFAYQTTKSEHFLQALNKHLTSYKNGLKSKDGVYSHLTDKCQIWSDGMFMSPPTLLHLSTIYPQLEQEAFDQVTGIQKYLQDPVSKLWWHIYDVDQSIFRRKLFWGVGIGWVCSGITRMVWYLMHSERRSNYKKLFDIIKETLDSVLKYMLEDGSFHDVVDDKSTFVEYCLSEHLVYTIYRLVTLKLLSSDYLIQADKMRNAVHHHVDRLGWVYPVCGSPHFNAAGTSSEGQSLFLMMEAAVRDYHCSLDCKEV